MRGHGCIVLPNKPLPPSLHVMRCIFWLVTAKRRAGCRDHKVNQRPPIGPCHTGVHISLRCLRWARLTHRVGIRFDRAAVTFPVGSCRTMNRHTIGNRQLADVASTGLNVCLDLGPARFSLRVKVRCPGCSGRHQHGVFPYERAAARAFCSSSMQRRTWAFVAVPCAHFDCRLFRVDCSLTVMARFPF